VLSTILVLLLAIPAAYALSIKAGPQDARRALLLPVHQMLPGSGRPAAALTCSPRSWGVLDNINFLVLLYASMNLPSRGMV